MVPRQKKTGAELRAQNAVLAQSSMISVGCHENVRIAKKKPGNMTGFWDRAMTEYRIIFDNPEEAAKNDS